MAAEPPIYDYGSAQYHHGYGVIQNEHNENHAHQNHHGYGVVQNEQNEDIHAHQNYYSYGVTQNEQNEDGIHARQNHHVPDHDEPKGPLATSTDLGSYQAISWPGGPMVLRESIIFNVLNGVLDTLLILVTLAFLGLAIMAMRLEDTSTETSLGSRFEEAMKLAPTIYPLLFAAIIGRALKGIGRFRAERGSQISTLWPLFNNKTMFDAVISQWQLGQVSVVASGLVILWALSPLGGQAALRLVYRANLTSIATQDLRYLDTGTLGNVYAFQAVMAENDVEKDAAGIPSTMPTLYEAALMQAAAIKRGPVDNWGNIKIPRVDQLNSSMADPDGWIDIGNETSVESYYSLLGLPIVNLPTEGVAEFTVESVYVALAAASHRSFGPPRLNNVTNRLFAGLEITCPDCMNRFQNSRSSENNTIMQTRQKILWGPPYPQPDAAELADVANSGARSIQFDSGTISNGSSLTGTSTVMCTVTQHFVEADIRCVFGSCRAERVRVSTTDHRHPNITTFDWWGTSALDMISVLSSSYTSTVSSSSDLFMNDSNSSPTKPAFQTPLESMVNISLADPQIFADRATMLLNTALQIFMAPSGFTGDLPKSDMSVYGLPHIPADGIIVTSEAINHDSSVPNDIGMLVQTSNRMAPFVAANTTAKVTTFKEVYKPDRAWVAVLILSSTVLLITGGSGMFLGSRTRAPDVFDPLMGLTYNNPHLNVAGHASTLSGSERARLLSGVTVRLGDVRPCDGVGKISLGQKADVQQLSKGRLYE